MTSAVRFFLLLSVVSGSSIVSAQSPWEPVNLTTPDSMSIAPGSLLLVSAEVFSVWVQHRGVDGARVAERYEVNCKTQQRRLLEVWGRPELPDSAPSIAAGSGWTRTEPGTPMRDFVVRACAIRR